MRCKYDGIKYDSLKEAFEEFLIDINSDDVEFRTKKEAYDYFKENMVVR